MNILEEAILFATKAHEGAKRKNSSLPYILHPCEAAAIAGTMTSDLEVLAAVVLHDVVEDTAVTIQEIEAAFGFRVASLVAAETEDKREYESPEVTWVIRKTESIEHLRNAENHEIQIMWLADKLSNMRAIIRDYHFMGDEIWNTFHMRDKKQHEWYYRTILELLSDWADYDAWKEFSFLIDAVFGQKQQPPGGSYFELSEDTGNESGTDN